MRMCLTSRVRAAALAVLLVTAAACASDDFGRPDSPPAGAGAEETSAVTLDHGEPVLVISGSPARPAQPILDEARLTSLLVPSGDRTVPALQASAAAGEQELWSRLLVALSVDPADRRGAVIDESMRATADQIPPVSLAPPVTVAPLGWRAVGTALRAAPPSPSSMAGVLGTAAVIALVARGLDDVRSGPTDGGGFDQPGDFRQSTKSRAAGRQTFASTKVRDGVTVTTSSTGEFDLEFCPDPAGRSTGHVEFDVRVDLGAPPVQRSGSYHVRAGFTVQVDDNANAAVVELEIIGSTGATTGVGSASPSGSFVEVRIVGTQDLTTASATVTDATITRASRDVDTARATEFASQLSDIAASISLSAIRFAEEHWRSGSCVQLDLQPDADPTAITPGQRIGVDIVTTAVADGQPTGGTVTTRLTAGGDGVVPDGVAQPAPAHVTYVAPPVSGGTITAELASRRGLGTGTLTFTPAAGWVVDGNDGVFDVYGIKCDGAAGTWQLTMSARFDGAVFSGTVTAELDPETLTGRFTLDGVSRGAGLAIAQSGTGTMSFVADGDTGVVVFETDSWQAGTVAGGHGGDAGRLDARRATAQECA